MSNNEQSNGRQHQIAQILVGESIPLGAPLRTSVGGDVNRRTTIGEEGEVLRDREKEREQEEEEKMMKRDQDKQDFFAYNSKEKTKSTQPG